MFIIPIKKKIEKGCENCKYQDDLFGCNATEYGKQRLSEAIRDCVEKKYVLWQPHS